MPSRLSPISRQLITQAPELAACDDIETKVALVLLLSHLIPADGKILDCEINRLIQLAARRFHVETTIVRKFIIITQFNRKDTISPGILAKIIKEKLDHKHLKIFIKDLWDIAMIDDNLDGLEEAMIYDLADQLGIARRDVIELQIKASKLSA